MRKNLLALLLIGASSVGFASTNPWGGLSLKDYGFVSPFKKTSALVADYCIPAISNPEAITSVIFGEINNQSPANSNLAYEDFTSLAPANLTPGEEYEIKLKGYTGGNFSTSFTVFIDFNQNKVFDEEERFNIGYIANSTGVDDVELVGNITIPIDALPGDTRMRVMKRFTASNNTYAQNGCNLGSNYGQVEDYTVKLAGAKGCLTAPNGQYPTATYSLPTADGVEYAIIRAGWTGEYSKVRVKKGYNYTFKSSVDTHFITIGDEAGENILRSGTGTVTWKADETKVVRFYLHNDEECNYQSTGSFSRIVSAMAPSQTDEELCNPGNESNDFENGSLLGGEGQQRLAINFDANPGQIIKASKINLSLFGDATSINFDVYSSNEEGLPDQLLKTVNGTISEKVSTGTHFNFPTYTYTVDFSEPIEIKGDEASRYWLEVKADVAAIETTTVSPSPVNLVFASNATQNAWRYTTAAAVYSLETECSYAEPEGDACDQVAASNNFENGSFLGGDSNQRLAIDIPVAATQKLTATEMELNLFNEPTAVNFSLYNDDANAPGALIQDVAGTIVSSTQIGTAFNYPIYKVVVKFQSPIALDGAQGTKYWLEVKADALAWETTTATTIGSRMAFNNNNSQGNWVVGTDEAVYKLVAVCEGEGPGGPGEGGDYCIPTNLLCDDGDVLTNVTFGTINNTTTCGAGGYNDFTAMSTDVKRNASYEFSASTGAGWQYESVHVWIDYNHDGVFTEEEYTYIGSNPGGTVTNMITIPENALEGATRMRVRVFPMPGPDHPQASIAYGNEGACYDNAEYPYGEIEDYTVNIGELGLTNVNDAAVKLYPNPVHDVLTIESKTAIQSVEIYNIAGQMVNSISSLNKSKTEINVSKLTPGVYVVRTTDANGNINSYKVVKK